MIEKQVNCIFIFGVSAVLALMAWISLWSFLALPFIIILITEDNEAEPKLSSVSAPLTQRPHFIR